MIYNCSRTTKIKMEAIMDGTPYHWILGKERISKICVEGGLTPADDRIVYEFLCWKSEFDGSDKILMEAISEELKKNPRSNLIKNALRVIDIELAIKTGFINIFKKRR